MASTFGRRERFSVKERARASREPASIEDAYSVDIGEFHIYTERDVETDQVVLMIQSAHGVGVDIRPAASNLIGLVVRGDPDADS